MARKPPKLCRFMTPAKALADGGAGDVDELAGERNASAETSAPTSSSASGETRNSTSFALGLDLGLGVMAAHAPATRSSPWPCRRRAGPRYSRPSPPCARQTTWQSSTFSTVTGTWLPSSVKMRVMPSFLAIRPVRMTCSLELDLDIDAGGEVELHQRVHGLRRRIDDVEHPLMGADLELLARLLVDVRRA